MSSDLQPQISAVAEFQPPEGLLPGEAVTCQACGSRIGLTRHGRIANHNWPATPILCDGSGTLAELIYGQPVSSTGEETEGEVSRG